MVRRDQVVRVEERRESRLWERDLKGGQEVGQWRGGSSAEDRRSCAECAAAIDSLDSSRQVRGCAAA